MVEATPPRREREGRRRILVVDDEADTAKTVAQLIMAQTRFVAGSVTSGGEALAVLRRDRYDVILLDLVMPDLSGLELMKRYRDAGGELAKVIVMTGFPTTENAWQAAQLGACDYLKKPFTRAQVLAAIEAALSEEEAPPFGLLVGASAPIERIRQQIADAAGTDMAVLIEGETGTGKELVAREIHRRSGRRGAFVACSCGALPEGLVASELFGHVRGAFTGAVSDRTGRFEEADRGTLFLDEIGEIDAGTQVKLLRVLQEREFEPVGSSATRRVDLRIVAATNKKLAREVEAGRFRRDLFYRIKGFQIETPPLRERMEDLPLLCAHVLGNLGPRTAGAGARLATKAMEVLQGYDWPGNVRELENVLRGAAARSRGGEILPEHLALPAAGTERDASESEIVYRVEDKELRAAREAFEKAFLERALDRHGGHVTRTAKAIGIARRTLQEKIERHRIEVARRSRSAASEDAGGGQRRAGGGAAET